MHCYQPSSTRSPANSVTPLLLATGGGSSGSALRWVSLPIVIKHTMSVAVECCSTKTQSPKNITVCLCPSCPLDLAHSASGSFPMSKWPWNINIWILPGHQRSQESNTKGPHGKINGNMLFAVINFVKFKHSPHSFWSHNMLTDFIFLFKTVLFKNGIHQEDKVSGRCSRLAFVESSI